MVPWVQLGPSAAGHHQWNQPFLSSVAYTLVAGEGVSSPHSEVRGPGPCKTQAMACGNMKSSSCFNSLTTLCGSGTSEDRF